MPYHRGMSRPRKGDRFTHDRFIEPGWKPSRTQTWSDAPKAQMQVTDVANGVVHYGYVVSAKADTRQSMSMDQAAFLAAYGDRLKPALTVIDGGGYDELIERVTTTYNRLREAPHD